MKHYHIFALLLPVVIAVAGCSQKTDDDMAAPTIEHIEVSLSRGDFRSALDSIVRLRDRFPKAVKARQRALVLWQEASLLEAQYEVGHTDSLLQQTLKDIESAPTLLEQNLLRNKRDSLQARYDAECGVVRIIREKMKNNK